MEKASIGRFCRRGFMAAALAGNLTLASHLYLLEAAALPHDAPYESLALFTRVLEHIREYYADSDRIAYTNLVNNALLGLLSSLDPYSQYLDAELFEEMKNDAVGQFGGVGIVISMRDGNLMIVAPMEDTPAFRAGLLAGDEIREIDGKTTQGIAMEEAVKRLRGEPGTQLLLSIQRPETREPIVVQLERTLISVASVKDAKTLTDEIGYVRLTQFNEPTAESLREAVAQLGKQGIRGLVIDVRNNPGGLLTTAIEVTQLFLPRGELVVSTRGQRPEQRQVYRSRGRSHFLDLQLAILVNGGSASAAEIFGGALQDHRRAVLIGEKTFGKGSVQSVLPLGDGSALRLTTAHYFTPLGRLIHERGLEPDILVPVQPDDWQRLMRERAEAEVAPDDKRTHPGSPLIEDVQLRRALDVLKGILIFQAQHHPAPGPA